jgi:hypothetical protein
VEGHHDHTTGGDLRKSATVELQDLSGTGLGVVVTGSQSLTADIGGISSEAGGILLEGIAASAITGSGRVDCGC